jgi:DNA-binding FrmR family transcriptional regulator
VLNESQKSDVEARLRRISGQVEGVQRMVISDRYCVDVLTQIAAARAALAKVSKLLLESHIQTCVASAFESDDEAARQDKIDELVRVFEKNC